MLCLLGGRGGGGEWDGFSIILLNVHVGIRFNCQSVLLFGCVVG